jgi:hypothetical protein
VKKTEKRKEKREKNVKKKMKKKKKKNKNVQFLKNQLHTTNCQILKDSLISYRNVVGLISIWIKKL